MDIYYRVAPEVAWVDSGDQVTILRLRDDECRPWVLSGDGAEIWKALSEGLNTLQVARQIADRYETTVDAVLDGLEALLSELESKELLKRASSPGRES